MKEFDLKRVHPNLSKMSVTPNTCRTPSWQLLDPDNDMAVVDNISFHTKTPAMFQAMYFCHRYARTTGDCTLFIYNKNEEIVDKIIYHQNTVTS